MSDLLPLVLDAFKRGGKRLFTQIVDAEPDLVRTAAVMERHQERTAIVQEFERELRRNNWSEGEWEAFFASNTWIFGPNLAFQFLGTITTQPNYVAPSVFGGGGQRGDFLMSTTGDARFAEIVDIKKPDALLVRDKPYRERVHAAASQLNGGVAQAQAYCSRLELKAQTDTDDSVEFDRRRISPLQPKGILIVGRTSSLDTRHKRDSFARFRHNTLNPEIITYDELLERARFIVNSESEGLPADDFDADVEDEFDDVPFD